MKKTLLLLLAIFVFIQFAQAQKITGQALTTNQKAIEGAVVSLLYAKDSSFVKTTLTDVEGKFELLNLKSGRYLVMISNIGYLKQLSQVVDLQQNDVLLPTFVMQEGSGKNLAEVKITAKKPFVEQKIDRIVVNPDALISNAAASSLEVLEKSPGIQVDVNGNISLKGKAGVMVYIDDKPTYLSAADLANYLRGLPSGSIESVEIMTNPPAKYDAAGNAGIINIKLKRNVTKGFNGSLSSSYGQGRYARSNNSLNFNYRINKVNFFSNLSVNQNNSYQDLTIWRTYFKPTGELNSAFTQNSYIQRNNGSANLKLGVDYYISKKATMGFVLSGFRNLAQTDLTNNAKITNAKSEIQSLNEALSPSKKILKNGSINWNYSYQLDSTGKELTANLDYIVYDSDLTQSLINTALQPDRTFINRSVLDSSLPATINIKTAKIDYAQPLSNKAKFESGIKTSWIATGNLADFRDVLNGIASPNYQFSNDFKYNENINAAYANYSKEGARFSIQAGLRFENTAIEGHQLGNKIVKDSSFTRSYNSLFPTFYANYKIDSAAKHVLGFSFGRRINRPDYQSLNPFTYPMDRFTLYGGNPFLRPTFSYDFQLSHTYNNMLTNTLQFSVAKDIIFETIEQGTNVFYSRPGNIGQQISFDWSVSGAFPLAKWWTLQLYSEVAHNRFVSDLYGQKLRNIGTFWVFMPTNMLQINKKWSAEVSGSYQTPAIAGQFVVVPMWTMRAAASKKIWKDKGTLKLSLNDVFYTQQPGGDIKGLANSAANWLSYLDTRVVSISLSYRFNKGQNLKIRKSGGSEAEQSRVKA